MLCIIVRLESPGSTPKTEDGGYDYCGFLCSFGNNLEEELSSYLSQRDVTDFIDRDKIVTGPARQRAAELQLMLGFN